MLPFLSLLPLLACGLHGDLSSAARHVHDRHFTPHHILRATSENLTIDRHTRPSSVVVNGTDPGPTIRLREGETRWIRVYNDILDQNLMIHWHGLTQRVAPFSDGTPQVS
jgi:L-ascorbate oxidase